MNKLNHGAAMAATLITVLALTACSGGSSSSSGSGTSGGGSSTLVVNSSPSMALLRNPHEEFQGVTYIAAAISSWLMQNAWAAPLAGSEVIVFNGAGAEIPPTSGDADMLYYVVPTGQYTVCVYPERPADPMPSDDTCSDPELVGPDSVVVVTAVPTNDDVRFDVAVETREDNIALFQNPDRPNQTYVCHKGRVTKSVGTPASIRGHKAHGDSLGPCDNFGPEQQNTNGNPNSNNNGGKGGNNGNRCGKGNKPKKGCPTNEQA